MADLDVVQHPSALSGRFRIQLHRSDHPLEDIAYPLDSVFHATGKEIIERRAGQYQSDHRIGVHAPGRSAPGTIELQHRGWSLFERNNPDPGPRAAMFHRQLHETRGSEPLHLIMHTPVRPARGGGESVYTLLTRTGLNQPEQLFELARPTHRGTS
ncbi:MAG TPA: hypothetical protein VGT07_03345 [Steroidobacteraceae bacterium]|nr:hypothetical protein [Steroidobacteraceae bacterium]